MDIPDGQYANSTTTVFVINATIYQAVDHDVCARVFVIIHCTYLLFIDQLTSTLIAIPVHTNSDTTDVTPELIFLLLKKKTQRLVQPNKACSIHMPTMVHGLPTHGGETGGVVTVITLLEKVRVRVRVRVRVTVTVTVRVTVVDAVDVGVAVITQAVAEVDAQVVDTTVWDEMLDLASVMALIFKLTIVKIKLRK